ncbi:MAG: 50S ribosomal protein L18 [Actinobacteria bacterium]|nr:50S ribosomal protein L18 [Actinomycetota bacterium]
MVKKSSEGRARRRRRIRKKISGMPERPRLSVFRANRNMSCQVIDDERGVTLVSASTLENEFRDKGRMKKTEAAEFLGAMIAKRSLDKGVTAVVFDRGGYKYHGRVKALADSARENGLIF